MAIARLALAADEYAAPANCGWEIATDHGAVADGTTDVTQALCNLPFSNKNAMGTMFFPNGTYLVTDTVFVGGDKFKAANKRLTLQGESREGTIIRLADNSPGFGDPKKPKPVITFHKEKGSTGQAFGNSIYNLTIIVGKGNPGAIAVNYVNNNQGCIRNVRLEAEEGSGYAGLALTFNWPGPGYVKNLEVNGFDYGIFSTCAQYSMVFEQLRLKGQRVAGVKDARQMLRFRDVISENSVPAFELGSGGTFTLLQARLNGGKAGQTAIVGGKDLYLQDVTCAGYDEVVAGQGKKVDQYASRGVADFGGGLQQPLMLRPQSTPDVDPGPVHSWVYVNGFDGDSLQEKMQKAIDSGARTLYFNEDEALVVEDTIYIRNNVECILGMGAPNRGGKTFKGSDKPVFRIEDGNGKPLLIDRFPDSYGAETWMFEIASARTVIFRNMVTAGVRNSVPGGMVFIEDVCGSPFFFTDNQVYARQWNPEEKDGANIALRGSKAWVFGLKTEYGQTVLDLDGGAQAEVYGLFSYHTGKAPWFVIGKGAVTVTNPSLAENGYATWFAINGENKGKRSATLLTGSTLP